GGPDHNRPVRLHAQSTLFRQQHSGRGGGGGHAFLARGGGDTVLFRGGLCLCHAPGRNGASRKTWGGVRCVCCRGPALFPVAPAEVLAGRGRWRFFLGAIQTKPRIRSAGGFSSFLNSAGGNLALARSVMAPPLPDRPRSNSLATSARR